jgi:hypothetical protein
MTVGQNIFIEGAGTFEVVSKADSTHVLVEYLDYTGNTHAGSPISAGAGVSPSGTEPDTGNTITEDNDQALAYDITNSYGSVGVAVAVVDAGVYAVAAQMSVLFTGVTFAASRTLSIRVRNVTQNTTIAETTRQTNTHTTTGFPAIDYVTPIAQATLAASDSLELQCFLDTVESAGSSVVTAGQIALIPLQLT